MRVGKAGWQGRLARQAGKAGWQGRLARQAWSSRQARSGMRAGKAGWQGRLARSIDMFTFNVTETNKANIHNQTGSTYHYSVYLMRCLWS